MSYARSAAFKVFQKRIKDLRRAVNAASRLRIGGTHNQLYREAMLSSTILLGFAYFEAYVSDVVDGACRALCSCGVTASALPADLRVQVAIAAHIKQLSEIRDPVRQRNQIKEKKNNGVFDILNDTNIPSRIDAEALLSGVTYPKLDNIRRLLARMGIANPKAELISRGGHSIEQKLTSIHDVRAELAHTGVLPAWTPADYEMRLSGLEDFAKAFDKILHRHVIGIVPSNNWVI